VRQRAAAVVGTRAATAHGKHVRVLHAVVVDVNKARTLSDQLAKMPHYHVVTQSDGCYLDYSDGYSEPGALGYAADLISPTSGEREEGLEVVWIAKVDPRSCPLAHGDDPEKFSEDARQFLGRIVQDEPYWSALW
jgi:hypothetical protein